MTAGQVHTWVSRLGQNGRTRHGRQRRPRTFQARLSTPPRRVISTHRARVSAAMPAITGKAKPGYTASKSMLPMRTTPRAARASPGCTILCFPGAPGRGVDRASVTMSSDASARARVGYLVTPAVLLYGTGGIAWQHVRTLGFCQHSVADPHCTVADGFPFDTRTNRQTLAGWTIDGGIESMISGNWLLRAEYRYADFGTFDGVLTFGAPGVTPGTDFHRYNLSVTTHIATFGLAYKFGGHNADY